jgi:hypothetical protein
LLNRADYGGAAPGDVIGNATSGLVQDAMKRQVGFLDPYFKMQTDRQDAKLKNQGFEPGQRGYDFSMKGTTDSQAATVQDFLSKIEPQMYQQAQQNYLMPLTMSQIEMQLANPTLPQQFQTKDLNVAPANLIGATANAQQAQMEAYKADQAKYSSMLSGAMGVPTAVLGGMAQAGAFTPLLAGD